ncbi:MAG: tyrosine-type recombinase/integrase [Candidatus Njordarchaeia archaeon]
MSNSELKALIEEFLIVNYQTEFSKVNVGYLLRWFERYLIEHNKTLDNLKPMDIVNFRRWLSEKENRHGRRLALKSIKQVMSLTKTFLEFAESFGYKNPYKELPPKIQKRLSPRGKVNKVPREFSDEELEKIFSNLREKNPNVYLACLIAYSTGARLNEVVNLRAEDVIERKGRLLIIIRRGKGLKERVAIVGVPYKDPSGNVLSETLKRLNEEANKEIKKKVKEVKKGYLFGDEKQRKRLRMNIQQTLYRIGKRTGTKVHFHEFRSNWGAKALAARVPLEYVSKQLGHAHTSTTEDYYAQVKDDLVFSYVNNLL